jgi:hypothetical protein
MGTMLLTGETESIPVPLRPPQIPRGLGVGSHRVCAIRGLPLTICAHGTALVSFNVA